MLHRAGSPGVLPVWKELYSSLESSFSSQGEIPMPGDRRGTATNSFFAGQTFEDAQLHQPSNVLNL